MAIIIGELSEEAKRNVARTIKEGIEAGTIDLSPEKLAWAREEKARILKRAAEIREKALEKERKEKERLAMQFKEQTKEVAG